MTQAARPSKWTHSRFPNADQDHNAQRKSDPFGRDICRHCGGFIVLRDKG